MELLCIGVKVVRGVGKDSHKPFEISRVMGLLPVATGSQGTVEVQGFGFEAVEVDLAPGAISQFAQVAFPARLQLRTEQTKYRDQMGMRVTGLQEVKPAVSVPADGRGPAR